MSEVCGGVLVEINYILDVLSTCVIAMATCNATQPTICLACVATRETGEGRGVLDKLHKDLSGYIHEYPEALAGA